MTYSAPETLTVGHTHLKVADLERSVAFYRDVMGFDVTVRSENAAFLSAGGYHHHLGLNTWSSENGPRPARNATGLYHVAFLYPDRASLGLALANLRDHGIAITGAADHGVSEAIYFDDPDGNGIEIYRDRAPEDWPRASGGGLKLANKPLDLDALLAEAYAFT